MRDRAWTRAGRSRWSWLDDLRVGSNGLVGERSAGEPQRPRARLVERDTLRDEDVSAAHREGGICARFILRGDLRGRVLHEPRAQALVGGVVGAFRETEKERVDLGQFHAHPAPGSTASSTVPRAWYCASVDAASATSASSATWLAPESAG